MTEPVAVVHVSWGMWCAYCPRDGCLGSEHFGHAPITGHVGGLTQVGFRCSRCELVCAAKWPDNAEDIWSVLAQRPAIETRSWYPGESLSDLLMENGMHGLNHDELTAGIHILGDRLADRTILTASRRTQIGA